MKKHFFLNMNASLNMNALKAFGSTDVSHLIVAIATLPVLTLSLLISGVAYADTDPSSLPPSATKELQSLYGQSGIDKQFVWVEETVKNESNAAWSSCDSDASADAYAVTLQDLYSAQTLRTGFYDQLQDRISDEQLSVITEFMGSELGEKLIEAESASGNMSENEFNAMLDQMTESGSLTEDRVTAIKLLLADTGAIYLLSALHTEVSSLVAMASVCSNSAKVIEQAESQIREDRAGEALYRSFMRREILKPATVIYRDMSDADIKAIREFATSDAGNAYYSALIKGIRVVLATQVNEIKLALQALPEAKVPATD